MVFSINQTSSKVQFTFWASERKVGRANKNYHCVQIVCHITFDICEWSADLQGHAFLNLFSAVLHCGIVCIVPFLLLLIVCMYSYWMRHRIRATILSFGLFSACTNTHATVPLIVFQAVQNGPLELYTIFSYFPSHSVSLAFLVEIFKRQRIRLEINRT